MKKTVFNHSVIKACLFLFIALFVFFGCKTKVEKEPASTEVTEKDLDKEAVIEEISGYPLPTSFVVTKMLNEARAPYILSICNSNENIDLDLGLIGFDQINPLVTSDRRLIDSILNIEGNEPTHKLFRAGIEFEGDNYATFRNFDKNNAIHCYLWANALDIALSVKNVWQLQFSINFPNYANITNVPEIATWLVSKSSRDGFMKDYYIVFLKDLTATFSRELHNNTLRNIDLFYGEVEDSRDVTRCWERK